MLIALSVAVCILVGGWIYQAWGAARDRRKFLAPGRLINAGAGQMHVVDSGVGNPPVVLESGLAATHLNWTVVQDELSRTMRVCSYDRGSLGWSDAAKTPRLLATLIEELHQVLTAADVASPCILVGHSFGGLLVRCYAVRHPDRVGGLVLVDPLATDEWLAPSESRARMLRRGAMLALRGGVLARFGVVRLALAVLSRGGRSVPKFVARVSSSSDGESAIERVLGEVRKMPSETWPIVRAHWCLPKCFRGLASYVELLPANSAEAASIGMPPEQIPVTIISGATATPAQIAERDAIAGHSQHGNHVIARNTGHWVHLDEPELVVDAIRQMSQGVCAGPAAHSK